MIIASLQFLAFALIAALAANLLWPSFLRHFAFLALNLWFLTSFTPSLAALFPLFGFLLAGYAAVRLLDRPSPFLFRLFLGAIVLSFFWLKKYSFLPSMLFLDVSYTTIGLSYIFFRVAHMIIDANDGTLPKRVSLIAYLNYTLNFTTLVSGPIQRFQDFARSQSAERPPLDWIVAGQAVERIALGFFKVIVLGTILFAVHQQVLAALPEAARLTARIEIVLAIVVSYAVYLYFNFSGYTDIVIGVARFLRIELPENFNRPFSATNFMDFWGRWHMTLSNWLKTYVYNPLVLGLMKRFPSPSIEPLLGVIAFFVTFFLIGLWHGQTAMFALYGVLLGVGVSGNKLYQVAMARMLGRRPYRALAARPLYQAVARGLTFTWFSLSLVCFWANWQEIVTMTSSLGAIGFVLLCVALIVAASLVLGIIEGVRTLALAVKIGDASLLLSRYVRVVWVTALSTVAFAMLLLMATPAPDIVYKVF
jgi:alginate O-acetyltransferase complex protein AlgI